MDLENSNSDRGTHNIIAVPLWWAMYQMGILFSSYKPFAYVLTGDKYREILRGFFR